MRQCLLSLVCLFFSFSVFAQAPNTLSTNDANIYEFFSGVIGKNISVSIYQEGGSWVVEQRTIDIDGLPDLILEKSFRTADAAYDFAKTLGVDESHKLEGALDASGPTIQDILSMLPTLVPKDVLWKAENTWNWEWEVKFAAWVRENLHPQFFLDLGIENDCADAYYQARIIFARINKLPVSFRLASGNAWFTNSTMRTSWQKLKTDTDWKKDRRFLEVLDYIANNTYTHTLGRDTYPVELTKDGLIEGTAFLTLGGNSGHTLIVNEINLEDESSARLPMYTLNSTVPKGVQPLTEYFFFHGTPPERSELGTVGFVRFRWPVSSGSKELVAAEDMPHYSEEQYDPELMNSDPNIPEDDPARSNFSIFVFKRLNPNFDPALRITEGLDTLKELLVARADIVEKGYQVCSKGCDPAGADYDSWSTPSRDKRIKELMHDLESYQSNLYAFPSVVEAWNQALSSNIIELEGTGYPLSLVKWVWLNDLFNSDPNVIPGIRWGVQPEHFAQASYEAINPAVVARKNKIDSAPACTGCELFSLPFLQSSTYIEDTEINEQVSLRAEYCKNAGETLCEIFNKKLASFPTVVPTQTNFLETWNNIATLNSDPRLSPERRWGQIPDAEKALVIDGTWYMSQEISQDHLTILTSDTYPTTLLTMVDLKQRKVLFTNTQNVSTAWNMNKESSELVGHVYEAKKLIVLDGHTGQEVQTIKYSLPTEDSLYSYAWADKNTLLLSSGTQTQVYQRQENGLYDLTKTLPPYLTAIGNKGLIVDSTSQTISVYDLNSNESWSASLKPFILNVTPSYYNIQIYTNDTAIVSWNYYNYENSTSANGHIFVDLKTQELRELPLAVFSNNVSDKTVVASTETDTTVYFLDDQANVVLSKNLKGNCANCYSIDRFIQVGQTIYSIDKKARTVEAVAEIPAGYTFYNAFDNMVIISKYVGDTNTSALIELETGRIVVLAPSIDIGTSGTSKDFYPYITASHSITKILNPGTPQEQYLYQSFTSVLDPLNPEMGSITTVPYYGGECEEECEPEPYYEGDMMAGLLPIEKILPSDFTAPVLDRPVVKILKSVPASGSAPYRYLNLSDKKIMIFFEDGIQE